MKLTRLGGALLPIVLLAGCGSADTSSPADSAQAYFDGIATQTVGSLAAAAGAAKPGSPASEYATYLRASTRAAVGAGQPVDQAEQTADRTSDGFRFCQGSGSSKVCFEFTDITRAGGKVSDFSVNGEPIADRLAIGTDEAVRFKDLDASATFVAAYETTASDNLLVVVRISTGAGVGLDSVAASYQGTGAAPTPSAKSFGPDTVDPGSSADYLFAFPKAKVGGTVTLTAPNQGGRTPTVVLDVR